MKIKLTCPNDPKHNRFSVTAHVSQEWEVDGSAQFQKCIQESIDTIHAPDKDDFYLCVVCNAQSKAKLVKD
jgi:hypothetical protein